ncbi:hypothetical protein ACFW1P_11325 [Paenibacillus sp. NPDC058910]|uniref:hypothetical protein n=1 Tax=unclassified Paenibacillus TaxID=185978 RepID=UPI0036D11D74
MIIQLGNSEGFSEYLVVVLPDLPDKIHNQETDELIDSNHLISFTMFDAVENSNDHWVFICEEGKTLTCFEELLTVFWNLDDYDEHAVTVFYTFYPTFDEDSKS